MASKKKAAGASGAAASKKDEIVTTPENVAETQTYVGFSADAVAKSREACAQK